MMATYPDAEVAEALKAGARTWDFRHEQINAAGNVVAEEPVVSCTVSYADLADKIKRTVSVTLLGDTTFNPLTMRLRSYAMLLMPDGGWHDFPLGTFLLPTTDRKRLAGAGDDVITVQGYDSVQETLAEDKVLDRYVVAAGTVYTTAVQTVLTSAGFPTSQIEASTLTLPGAMEWEPGTEKLKIINDLLAAIDYRPIGSSPLGVPVAVKYVEPAQAPALWTYSIGPESVVRPGVGVSLDLFNIPNAWIGSVSEADRPPLVSVLVNADPDDPLSTVGRGRTIVRVLEGDAGTEQAATQAILDAKVQRAADESRQTYETATFSTALMPIHGAGDVCLLDTGDGSGPVRFRETEWSLECKAGGTMTHSFRRVVTL